MTARSTTPFLPLLAGALVLAATTAAQAKPRGPHAVAWADRLAHAPGKSSLRELNTLRFRITEQLRRNPPLQRGDLAINGQDVMRALHLEPGPRVGKILGTVQQ